MNEIKVYEYNSGNEANGYRGTDYTKYLLQGGQISENITQEFFLFAF